MISRQEILSGWPFRWWSFRWSFKSSTMSLSPPPSRSEVFTDLVSLPVGSGYKNPCIRKLGFGLYGVPGQDNTELAQRLLEGLRFIQTLGSPKTRKVHLYLTAGIDFNPDFPCQTQNPFRAASRRLEDNSAHRYRSRIATGLPART